MTTKKEGDKKGEIKTTHTQIDQNEIKKARATHASKISHLKKYFPFLTIIIASITAWSFGLHHYLSFDALKTHQHSLDAFINDHFFIGLSLYSGLYILIVALSLPVAALMTIAGGVLFGQIFGTLGAVTGATFGATFLFLSAKLASKDVLSKKAGSWAKKMQDGFQENALSYLLTLRLIPLFPFVAVNLVAAFLQISFRTFFLTTFFGIMPGSFVYVSLGVAIKEVLYQEKVTPHLILDRKILFALIGLGVLSLLPVFYKSFQRHFRSHSTSRREKNQYL